ncbi:MAG: class I SAM-dependent methyltransferase [Gammaproteobacteria bacterium]|nr:class I SAM-dependent methyltransferase [Gammaproteobacteria bacterium]MCB1925730.1 class I SAM-dependent methyltransferase [Gammaproteobacteria bacterium]
MDNDKQAYFGKDLEAMSFAVNYHQWIVDEFAPYLGSEVAEIGAGTGNFSAFLLDAGISRLAAFEPSANMYPLLEQRFAQDRRVDTFNDFFETLSGQFPQRFDAVAYVNVLEHIEDDTLALRHARSTLKPGGHLLIFVPALQFLYSELDRQVGHFRRYDRRSLTEAVESAGFEIIKLKYFDVLGIIPWYIAFTLMKQTTTGTNVSLYDRVAVPVMRRIERVLTPPVGKNLLLVARPLP